MSDAPVEGANAPDFDLPATGGGAKLSDYRGKPLILFFYPKDDTPGCTTEANEFTALVDEIEAAGGAVLGVSRDSLAKHEKFAAKHDLKVRLASDEDGRVCEAYHVWVEKKMYGKTYMGVERSTFLIDGDGRIAKAWRKVKPKGHAQAAFDALRDLTTV
ncbi:MAG: peroxiredoxin [Pseudomonadota bacterium]